MFHEFPFSYAVACNTCFHAYGLHSVFKVVYCLLVCIVLAECCVFKIILNTFPSTLWHCQLGGRMVPRL